MTDECNQNDYPHERAVDHSGERIPEEEHQRMSTIVQLVFRVLLVDSTSAEESERPLFVRFSPKKEHKLTEFCRSEAINLGTTLSFKV